MNVTGGSPILEGGRDLPGDSPVFLTFSDLDGSPVYAQLEFQRKFDLKLVYFSNQTYYVSFDDIFPQFSS